jgi:predicted nucleotidyltransferase
VDGADVKASLADAELLARQEALQAEARAFLVGQRVEPRLARTGRVVLVGSYATGLMVWRDLDVCVDAADLERARAWEVVRPFVLRASRVRYEHHDEPGDRRHYFVLGLDGWKLQRTRTGHSTT